MIPEYLTYNFGGHIRYLRDNLGILNKIKVGIESILNLVLKKPNNKLNHFYKMGLTWYILKKK